MALKRQLGVSYPTAWLIHHKLMQAMVEREEHYVLDGKVQVDDAYLGRERVGGKVGRGSENKVAEVADVSLSEDDHPLRVCLTQVNGPIRVISSLWLLRPQTLRSIRLVEVVSNQVNICSFLGAFA